MTLREAVEMGASCLAGLPQGGRDAELLLLRAIGRGRSFLMAHPEAELDFRQLEQYRRWLKRRAAHEPIQYITGEQEFFGLNLRVTTAVLIPRPETEHLVEALLARVPRDQPLRIVDVGSGSGAIAIALAHSLPQAALTALDLSPAALEIARENAAQHGLAERVRCVESDLLAAVTGERFDAVVSNPPYIADTEELEPQVFDYEPRAALFAGPTGMEIYRRLIPQARQALEPGGWLVLEIGFGQREAVGCLLEGWEDVTFLPDLQGIPRVAAARARFAHSDSIFGNGVDRSHEP
ncbi:MAG TPA: peptide chain release factor N(5)-glutamine methyltransferase [Acidobacteriaceae bacterium]|jgi:release factor glutamine methyltransferase|nr:peptide chain release factor N(5)-glutamine methyltransferase [Acidobacteriaceae bacterium]